MRYWIGSQLQIPRLITILGAMSTGLRLVFGFWKILCTWNGKTALLPYSGYTVKPDVVR